MTYKKFTYSDFIAHRNVSRETFSRLEIFIELLIKWQKTINLISESTVPEIWNRHVLDSSQLIDYMSTDSGTLVDIGSGAGFPGLVLAILGVKAVTLVESDKRKAAFLQDAARMTESNIVILNQRAELVSYEDYITITARAVAPVSAILNMLEKTLNSKHNILILKGKTYKDELEAARKSWAFHCEVFPSATDDEGVILSLTKLMKKEP